ncbi:MAG TPA: Crp/Fnr family transcriptional regulator [Bryobacteraceae bacterium]|nr:Crp/Fnr family transcriptional regulator [Bryobacteraceae bacterium]
MSGLAIPIVSQCKGCKWRKQNSFCNLPREALLELDRVKQIRTYAPGDRLFDEGKPANELMIVCEGTAILTFSSFSGNVAMLGLSERGEVLGLSSAISGRRYATSAEALESTRVAAISRNDFLKLLNHFPSAAMNAGAELSRKVNRAYDKIRLIGSGLSVPQRLASWLLHMQEAGSGREEFITVRLAHERIAQLLGVSRESVTRALSNLRKHGAVEVRGIHFYVRDRDYLRSLVQAPEQTSPIGRIM